MINFRTHDESVKYLYIEGVNLDGSSVLIAQASYTYSQGTQSSLNFHIFEEDIYNNFKLEIEKQLSKFRLACESELRSTENVLFGSQESISDEVQEVFDSEGNRIGIITLYTKPEEVPQVVPL